MTLGPLFSSLTILLAAATARAEPAADIDGTWRGTLAGQLRLVVTFTRAADGKIRGALESVDQGATLPIDSVTVSGGAVRFTVARVGGVYEGKLDKAHASLDGTWAQNGVSPQPLVFTRDSGKPGAVRKAAAPPGSSSGPLDAPIDVIVPVAPTPWKGSDGKTHLVYEAHVTNFSPNVLTLRRFEVLAPDGRSLSVLEPADLPGAVGRPGLPPAPGDPLRIGPGLRAVVYVWVTLPDGTTTPLAVENRVTVRIGDDAQEWPVKQRLVVRNEPAIVIGPPLRGTRWAAVNGPSNTSTHRRALQPIAGRAVIAQRFAIDWVQLTPQDGTSRGDRNKNASYLCYGAPALAVGDGTVVALKDDIAENVPGMTRAVPMTLETLGGNHVIVDLGDGHYAFYGHLQPKSLRVKLGEHIKRGQVLGLVGNSGNSTEPHLHFHIADAGAPLAAEGLPYVFDWSKQLPLEKELVDFPSGD